MQKTGEVGVRQEKFFFCWSIWVLDHLHEILSLKKYLLDHAVFLPVSEIRKPLMSEKRLF